MNWKDLPAVNYSLERVGLLTSRGPSGRNPTSRVIDLYNLAISPLYLFILIGIERMIHQLYDYRKVIEDTGLENPIPLQLPIGLIHILATQLKVFADLILRISRSALHKKSIEGRVLNRLSRFPDGLGKLRYIALRD